MFDIGYFMISALLFYAGTSVISISNLFFPHFHWVIKINHTHPNQTTPLVVRTSARTEWASVL